MKITCYAFRPDPPPLRAAPTTRAWMDKVHDNHAYRCLPLNIANSHGWEILSPCSFELAWTGGIPTRTLTAKALDGYPDLERFVVSHFRYGIVTFHLGYVFRTEPGWDLFASGSFNNPKDGIAPLTGVIETDWLPYPFTMNWQMTRPGTVRFEKDEPVCMIFPVPHGVLQSVELEILDLDSEPELRRQAVEWKEHREEFMKKFNAREPAAVKAAWQRDYFLGRMPDGTSPTQHLSKLRLRAPVDLRQPAGAEPTKPLE
jgi:hypothetical protein